MSGLQGVIAETAQPEPPKSSVTGTRLLPRTTAALAVFRETKPAPSPGITPKTPVRSKASLSEIASSTTSTVPPGPRTPSPLKYLTDSSINPDSPDPSIVLRPDAVGGNSLAKVYGSVLQPASTIASFVCSACDAPFLPDATIYPAPDNPKIYFCRSCFSENGGSRGFCEACGQEVIRLKAEGGFVENGGRVWHNRCFRCEGCERDISTRPMVDVLGRPCCDDCFDDCLKRGKGKSAQSSRNPSPASKALRSNISRTGTPNSRLDSTAGLASPSNNPGGLKKSSSYGGLSQGSQVVEELARRIGVSPSRSPIRDAKPFPPEAERSTSDLSRSITNRLTSLTLEPPSPGSYQSSQDDDNSSYTSKRIAAADFATSPPRLSHSGSSSSLTSSISSHAPTNETHTTPTKAHQQKSAENSLSGARTSLNSATSGLLTPGSTPTQSPTRTPPPARTINIASPPGSISKIPSLRGKGSLSGVTSPPRKDRGTPVSEIFSTPPRIPSSSSKAKTPSRIPSIPSPNIKGTPTRTNGSTGGRLSLTIPMSESESNAKCERCEKQLYSFGSTKGKIVSVPPPAEDVGGRVHCYHAECFRCDACEGVFVEQEGTAGFVRFESGVRHIECTPSSRLKIYKHASLDSISPLRESIDAGRKPSNAGIPGRTGSARPNWDSASSSSIPRLAFGTHRSAASIASLSSSSTVGASASTPGPTATPRFGSATSCPGCRMTVSPMERGIVPGPGATKWHGPCLVCGGKRSAANKRASGAWTGRDESLPKSPGCGKKLDSAAKGDLSEGVMWCRDCWDQTRSGAALSSTSPVLSPTFSTSSAGGIFPSSSSTSRPNSALGLNGAAAGLGTTTLARQISRSGSGATSPIRRHFQLPGTISEADVLTEFDEGDAPERRPKSVAGQYLSGRSTSPLKMQFSGMGLAGAGDRSPSPVVRPQSTGSGYFRSTSPVRRQYTGTTAIGGDEVEPMAIQYTGGGVPVTRQLTSRRPRSAVGMNRSIGSQKSMDGGRGMFLVRQMTGQAQTMSSTEGGGEVVD
ncbi:hypothetical protein FRB97_007557 [Tulasnella sp. 331]|nr:hypothetical protein FRB97_007557 [Tulasnella sp. 331]